MHKVIDITQVTKIEIAVLRSEADMFIYEIYYINKLKPSLTEEQINYIEQRLAYLEIQDLIKVNVKLKTRISLGVITEDDISIINELLSLKTHCFIGPMKIF